MKKIIDVLLCVILITNFIAYGQAPEGLSYQAIVRDAENKLAVNRTMSVQISLLLGSESGAVMYRETHNVVTNGNGLMILKIGQGNAITGVFSSIDWSLGTYFVKSEIDLTGGTNYSIVSTTQLLSVPYALYAKSAEKLAKSISYNDLTDLPEGSGFSGDYEDLTNKPELFDGKYSSLEELPELFSGDYEDLINQPELFDGKYSSLTEIPELFSSDYRDLTNKPHFKDSVERYGFSGSYNDLTDRPIGTVIVNYNDLEDKPVFKDSIDYYGFSGNYNELANKPDIFSGDYMDLTNRPYIKDSISRYAFDGNYQNLTQKPAIKDSVDYYGFSGDYEDLINKPLASMKDSVEKYGFSGDYQDLINTPLASIKDSVEKYGFSGDYENLTNKPLSNVKDSIEKYGFSGDYADLENKPSGQRNGDILYWQDGYWEQLSLGFEGQILAVADGKLAWIEPSFANTSASTYAVGDIYKNSKGEVEGIVVQLSLTGRFAKIMSLTETPLVWDPLATVDAMDDNYQGNTPIETNAADDNDGTVNLQRIRQISGWEQNYPLFDSANKFGENWYVPARNELSMIYENRNLLNEKLTEEGAATLDAQTYWSSTESDDFFAWGVAFKEYIIDYGDGDTDVVLSGTVYELIKSDELAVRFMRRLTWAEATSKPVESDLYSVGDIYYENNDSVGIVYKISQGGLHGYVISLEKATLKWSDEKIITNMEAGDIEDGQVNLDSIRHYSTLSNYPAFDWCVSLGDDWYLPSVIELEEIYRYKENINAHLIIKNLSDKILSDGEYWSSTEASSDEAHSIDFSDGDIKSDKEKDTHLIIRGIRKF